LVVVRVPPVGAFPSPVSGLWGPGRSRDSGQLVHLQPVSRSLKMAIPLQPAGHVTIRVLFPASCRPALPHIRKSRDSGHLFVRAAFPAHQGRWVVPVGGPSPGSGRGPPGVALPGTWTVGGQAPSSLQRWPVGALGLEHGGRSASWWIRLGRGRRGRWAASLA
jgi:hypothetical protein